MDSITDAVENLRVAMIGADRSKLEELTLDELSYGHANGVLEDKGKFIDSIVSGRNDYQSIELSDQTVADVGNIAIVRHRFRAEVIINSTTAHSDISVMQIWERRQGTWKLLARQAYKVGA